jgi:hypothetical protein
MEISLTRCKGCPIGSDCPADNFWGEANSVTDPTIVIINRIAANKRLSNPNTYIKDNGTATEYHIIFSCPGDGTNKTYGDGSVNLILATRNK